MSRVRELTRLRKYAEWAAMPITERSTPEEIRLHWFGQSVLLGWVKADPIAVVDLVINTARWDLHPGGIANQNVKSALAALPEVRKEDAA